MRKLILFLFCCLNLAMVSVNDSFAAIPPPLPPGYSTCTLQVLGDTINLGPADKQGCLKLCESSQAKGKLRCEFLVYNPVNTSPVILKKYSGNSSGLGLCSLENTYGKSNVSLEQCVAWCKDIYTKEGSSGPLRYLDSVKCKFNDTVVGNLANGSSNQSSCKGEKPCCMAPCPGGMCTQVCGTSKCVNGVWVCDNKGQPPLPTSGRPPLPPINGGAQAGCPCPVPTCGVNDGNLLMKNRQIEKMRKQNRCTNLCPMASCAMPTSGRPPVPMNTR